MTAIQAQGIDDPAAGEVFDFDGPYAEPHWQFRGGAGNGSVDKTKMPASIKITGSNNKQADDTDYLATVEHDGHIMFAWKFSSDDTPLDFPLDSFGYLLNGEFFELASKDDSNEVLLAVKAGDIFGFRIDTYDADGGSGHVEISNFRSMPDEMAPNDYEPGSVTIGGINIGKTGMGIALRIDDGKIVQIKSAGVDVSPDTLGWKALAAKAEDSGYSVYLKENNSEKYAKWHVEEDGAIVKGEIISVALLLEEEDFLGLDINDDGIAGTIYEDLSDRGGVQIGQTALGFAFKKEDGSTVHIKSNGKYLSQESISDKWQVLAATPDDDGSGYEVYLKNKDTLEYAKWRLDDNGALERGEIISKERLLEDEMRGDHDINDDGSIGDSVHDMNGDGSMDDVDMKMFVSSVTWTLEPDFEHLTLTGDDNIDGTGNDRDNFIEGNAGNNILDGKDGLDILTGHEGADTFRFTSENSFGPDLADHIIDFDPAEGDRIQVNRAAFGISRNASATLAIAGSDSEISGAARTAALFIYDAGNGCLYLNQNGSGGGFGGGGIFAVLENTPSLSPGHILLA